MTVTMGSDAAGTGRPIRRVAIVGTGLIGTSIAMAAARAGDAVTGWDADPEVAGRAAAAGGPARAPTLSEAVSGADLVVVCTPIPAIAPTVVAVLDLAPEAIVTDAGSIKVQVAAEVTAKAPAAALPRFVPGHPLGGSERSGPEHAAASVVDDIVWALAPTEATDPAAVDRLEGWITRIGARPVRLTPDRHDRLAHQH